MDAYRDAEHVFVSWKMPARAGGITRPWNRPPSAAAHGPSRYADLSRPCRNSAVRVEFVGQSLLGGIVKSRMLRFSVVAVLMVASLMALTPAIALPPNWTVTGTVTDTLGNPLQDVRVSDGFKSVLTDASGHYAIEEPILSSVTLTATKTGYRDEYKTARVIPCTQMEQLPCTQPVDFVLTRIDE